MQTTTAATRWMILRSKNVCKRHAFPAAVLIRLQVSLHYPFEGTQARKKLSENSYSVLIIYILYRIVPSLPDCSGRNL